MSQMTVMDRLLATPADKGGRAGANPSPIALSTQTPDRVALSKGPRRHVRMMTDSNLSS
jgi:hypothetical protein